MSASISVNPTPGQVLSVRGACPHDCPDTCGLVTTVENGVATRVQGNPDHPHTDGVLCAKVSKYTLFWCKIDSIWTRSCFYSKRKAFRGFATSTVEVAAPRF